MKYTTNQAKDILTLADNYAKLNTTCKKTAVGCYLIHSDGNTGWRTVAAKGCNHSEESCKQLGCLREQLFGNNSKEHRATCRCHGKHAEQDAIKKLHGVTVSAAFVTRYPCEECAKALIDSGIKLVVYGREFQISEQTAKMFEEANVEVVHISDWNCDENDKNN